MATQIQTTPHDANTSSAKSTSDTAGLGTSTTTNLRCPDPSAHRTKDTSFQDHASAAAFNYAGHPKEPSRKATDALGPDGKLSSASAATSLRRANAHDLPSFPVVGIDTQSSAGTAATIAASTNKAPERKPEHSTAAGKAALLATDYKMEASWKPEASAAGSKAALLAAHRGSTSTSVWTPEANPHGHSAATLAMRQRPAPEVDHGQMNDSRHRALVAATGAVSSSGRRRAQSTPVAPPQYPDSANSAKNALSAATQSMRAKVAPAIIADSNRLGSPAMEAARIQHSRGVSRDMYGSTPPVALEVEERTRQDALHASAISMAKQMYDVQQKQPRASTSAQSQAQTGAAAAHGHGQHGESGNIREQAMRYIGVQEAAQKLAAERLAKIGSIDENIAYRNYYGYPKPTRSRLSLRRRRSSSNPEILPTDDDEVQTRRIRSQMSDFNRQLAEVDAKKQDQDRKYLLAAAQRRVQAQMQGLDKKIFDETGQMSPAMVDDWDSKARAKAAAASEARMEHHGKVHIGQGKYMEQAEIDAVAQARIQPTLDEINEKTEKRRAVEEERRLDLEEKKREHRIEKEHAAELKAEEKRIRDEEKRAAKARTAQEKAAVKQEREAENAKKVEEKRMAQEELHKSDDAAPVVPTTSLDAPSPTTERPRASEDRAHDSLYQDPTPADRFYDSHEQTPSSPTSPTSPTSPRSESKGIKSFLNKFKRRSNHSARTAETDKPGFIGGVALRQSSAQNSGPSSPHPEAGRTSDAERRYSDVSSLSADAEVDDRTQLPDQSGAEMSPVPSGVSAEFEETRDSFDDALAPPPSFTVTDVATARKGSPNRDSRFHEVGI